MPTAMEMVALQRNFPAEYGRWDGIRIGRALVLRGQVDVPTLPKRRNVAVCFRGPPSRVRPVVMVSGPTHSRHRFVDYRPTSLCLYFGPDPQSMKWNINDGLVGLVDLIRQHLFKEEWWRATRQWSGPEVHLDPAQVSPEPFRARSAPRRGSSAGGSHVGAETRATALATAPYPSRRSCSCWGSTRTR